VAAKINAADLFLMLNPLDGSTIEFEGGRALATRIARTAIAGELAKILEQWVEVLENDS